MTNVCIVATIVVYLAAMLAVGFAYSKSNEDSTDFYLGGRKMGPLVTAMSAEASDMSSWLLMGMPGLAYLSGIASPGWTRQEPLNYRKYFPKMIILSVVNLFCSP